MHHRALAVAASALLTVLAPALTADAPAAAPPAPAAPASAAATQVDRRDPNAVAKAWLQAATAGDGASMKLLMMPDKPLEKLIAMAVAQFRSGPMGAVFGQQGLSELSLMPTGLGGAGLPGEPKAEGDTVTFPLQRPVQSRPKLILRKQADGGWAVDLRASLAAAAAPGESVLLRMAERMANIPEAAMAPPDQQMPPDEQPWACHSRMQQIANALDAYREEHEDLFPPADSWTDALKPYLDGNEGQDLWKCPSHAKDETHSYALNRALAGHKADEDWQARQRTVLLACTGANRPNATFDPAELPKLPGRHGKHLTVVMASTNTGLLPEGMSLEAIQQAQAHTAQCEERLRALVEAAKAYAKAHDDRLPKAETWTDDLAPLLRKPGGGGNPLVCPVVGAGECTYAINRDLAGRKLSELVNHRTLILFYETEPTTRNTSKAGDEYRGPSRHVSQWEMGRPTYTLRVHLDGGVDMVGGAEDQPR
jgi:hypothetical protein